MDKPEIEILHKAFDEVFCLNDKFVLPLNYKTKQLESESENEMVDELRGKIFAFSLEVYEKCIFISSDTIVLENCDKLFDNTDIPEPGIQFSGESDKMFAFLPNWDMYQFLNERYEQRMSDTKDDAWNNFIRKTSQAWLKNNAFGEKLKDNLELVTTKFSIKTGRAFGSGLGSGLPAVVQFVDADLCDMEFARWLNVFNYESKDMSLLDQVTKIEFE